MKKIFIPILMVLASILTVAVLCVIPYLTADSNKSTVYASNNGITATIMYVESYDGETLTLPSYSDNNLLITSIQPVAFEKGDFSKVQHLILPDGVTELPNGCFSNFPALEKVTLGNGLTSFNSSAFDGTRLNQVILKDGNTKFEILDGCLISNDINNTDKILWWGDHIPDTVTSIGEYAFYNSDIKAIDIPESVDRIGDYAFFGCSDILSLNIPGTVLYIGDFAFAECTSLKAVTLAKGVRTIADRVFSGCSSLASVSISDSLEEIGQYAFYNTSLSEIPNLGSVKHLSTGLFGNCNRMVSANIPQGIQSIGLDVFIGCDSLKSVHFPSTLRLIEDHMLFFGCDNINKITVAEENLNYYAENNCIIDRETMTLITGTNLSDIPYGTGIIGECSLALKNALVNVSIPDTVEKIESLAFTDSKQLRSIYIPASVIEVGTEIVGGNAEEMHIYCEAVEKPYEWEENWNNAGYPVTWGVTQEEYQAIVQ